MWAQRRCWNSNGMSVGGKAEKPCCKWYVEASKLSAAERARESARRCVGNRRIWCLACARVRLP